MLDEPDHPRIPGQHCVHQGGSPPIVHYVGVRVIFDQEPNRFPVRPATGQNQGGLLLLRVPVNLCPVVQQELDNLGMTTAGGMEEALVEVRPLLNQGRCS